MTMRPASLIVRPLPRLQPAQDRCVNELATNSTSASPTIDKLRDAAWGDAQYFRSLRKVGSDALLYQATE